MSHYSEVSLCAAQWITDLLCIPGYTVMFFILTISLQPICIFQFSTSTVCLHPGDPHASERIGPSCSRTQTGISVAEIMAALKGANLSQITKMQDALRALIKRYHGREVLFDWMKLQIEEAIFKNHDVTPYPEYIKALIRSGKLDLSDSRQHTKAYLESYNQRLAHPPVQYYQKVAKKDKVEELLTSEELASFKKIIE